MAHAEHVADAPAILQEVNPAVLPRAVLVAPHYDCGLLPAFAESFGRDRYAVSLSALVVSIRSGDLLLHLRPCPVRSIDAPQRAVFRRAPVAHVTLSRRRSTDCVSRA